MNTTHMIHASEVRQKSTSLRQFVRCGAMLLAGVATLITASGSQAGMLFDYTSLVNVATAPTKPTNPPGFNTAVIGIGSGNSLTFNTNSGAGIDGTIAGGADINFGTIVFNASANNTVVNYSINFNYQVTITDIPSGEIGTVNFTGNLAGNARGTPRAINSLVSNYAVAPQMLFLGGSTYTIAIAPVVGPGTFFDGVLQGNIRMTPVPEPTSLTLAGIAGVAMLAARRVRRGERAVIAC